jgi:hypothetical protein
VVNSDPERHRIDLASFNESQVLMVRGRANGSTLYAAKIVDEASPVVSALCRTVFG